ncbi:S6A14-like protein [Mya arenaria]|uniref:Transporter n=1 Tax=Mya arenaria TaxID=6604 RepID=A0ABY7E3B4_MYAAR|nr:S6A14-like protein [Mya arenaria]
MRTIMESPDTISVSNGHQQQSKTVKFSSTLSTYMTLLGYSLGFSDIWRFPFLAYRNGGGAFLIPFVIMTFVCGVPLYFLEYTISKFSGRGPYQVWDFCPLLRGVGITVSFAYFLYIVGTSIFRCWLYEFAYYSFYNPIPFTSCNNPWNTNTCRNESTIKLYSGSSMVNMNMSTVSVMYVENDVMYVTLSFPILFSIALFIRSMLLPGSSDGVYYYFYPNFAKLLNPRIWIEATLMVFYTLAFGWGAIMVMGSHASFRDNSYRTAIVCTFVDVGIAIFNGMVCFSVLGNMAHTYGIPITEVINAGFSTGLVSYITALSTLPLPQLWTFLFILSGVLSGMEAQMIPIEMVIQLIGDLFPRLKAGFRIPTLIGITVVMFFLSLPTCTGAGAYLFLLVDWYAGTWTGTIVALFEVISISWVIFFMSCVEYVPPNYGSYHYPGYAQAIGWGMVVIAVVPVFGYAVLNIYRAKGTVTQRISSLCRPTDTWGPCGDGMDCNYRKNKIKYSERTFWDLFYFNVFGRYPKKSAMKLMLEHELAVLRSENNVFA